MQILSLYADCTAHITFLYILNKFPNAAFHLAWANMQKKRSLLHRIPSFIEKLSGNHLFSTGAIRLHITADHTPDNLTATCFWHETKCHWCDAECLAGGAGEQEKLQSLQPSPRVFCTTLQLFPAQQPGLCWHRKCCWYLPDPLRN